MLELRPNCERCDRHLPFDRPSARICTFEWTFRVDCVDGVLQGVSPICGGGFATLPICPPHLTAKYPASETRVLKPGGCVPV